jgi:hypothetical protein
MQTPDPVETILARLMPPALSGEGQRGIEAMLDELAGAPAEVPVIQATGRPWFRRMIGVGIAAAGVAAALVFPGTGKLPQSPSAAADSTQPEFVLVAESDRVESMTDEGWQEDSDGSAMHALRLSVVEENRLFDEETGIVMSISEPREEIFLMPVNAF